MSAPPYEWLQYFPDTMLLDIASNAQFPPDVCQAAQNYLYTRTQRQTGQQYWPNAGFPPGTDTTGVNYPTRGYPNVTEQINVVASENPEYGQIVENEESYGTDYSNQIPPEGFNP